MRNWADATFRPCRPLPGPSSCRGITVAIRSGIPVDYPIPVGRPIRLASGFLLTNFPSPSTYPKTYLCDFLNKTVSSLTKKKLKVHSNYSNSSTLIDHSAYSGSHTWNHGIRRDNVLLGDLLPWLRRVHSECPPGQLRSFVDANRIGHKLLSASDSTQKDMMRGMRMSANEVGFRYELPGIGLVIEPRRRRT